MNANKELQATAHKLSLAMVIPRCFGYSYSLWAVA